jgi:hypothetical protein
MTKLITILIIILPTISFGQDINDSLLTTFYNNTIALYFSDTSFSNKTKFDRILLQTDFDTTKLIKYSGLNKFKYFDSKTNKHSVLDKPFKKNNGRNIYCVNHKIIQQDTIDINIGGWTIESVTKKTMSLGAWCGGTMGYIPDGRFIFDKEKKTWTFVSGQEIINQKMSLWKKE